MPVPATSLPSRAPRRLILGAALLLALAVCLPSKTLPARAQDTKPPVNAESPAVPAPAASDVKRGIGINIATDPDKDSPKAAADKEPAEPAPRSTTVDSGNHTVTIKKGGKTITVTGLPNDREFDSVGQFARMEPALATMIVAIVAVIFLSPVFAIALILSYRMRKARMLNETMLKLAEKGIVPPAEALDAVTGNRSAGAAAAKGPSTTEPFYEQAKALRKRAAWSDLRKGVVMGAIGFGLTLFSMLDDGTPNSLGLVLLFVGIGYGVLWWFEQRQLSPSNGNSSGNAGPGTGGPTAP